MNRKEIINEKLIFVHDYWQHLQFGKVDTFDCTYIVDMKSILIDLLSTIDRVRNNSPRNGRLFYSDLPFLCEEFISFYKRSYYRKSDISRDLNSVKSHIVAKRCFEGLVKDDRNRAIQSMNIIRGLLTKCIEKIERSDTYFYSILSSVYSICMNSRRLRVSIIELKTYLSELMSAGFEAGLSSIYLKDFFKEISQNRDAICNIKNFKLLMSKPAKRDITYIFSINNLYKQSPIKIDDVLIYNPMRKDLLEWMAEEKWYDQDYYLMEEDKKVYFDRFGIADGCLNFERNEYETSILYTDCHARITISALSISEGLDRAKSKVANIISLLCYKYLENEKKISIKKQYSAIDKLSNHSVSPFLMRGEQKIPSYYVRGFDDDLEKNISEETSFLNRMLKLQKKEILFKSIHWFNQAEESNQIELKYLSYFISLETLLEASNEYDQIKLRLIKIVPAVMVRNMYFNELISIYRYFINLFNPLNGKYRRVPNEILAIEGLNNFNVRIDLNAFRDNFDLFYKYCDSPYYLTLMSQYKKVYKDELIRNKSVDNLREKIEFILSRIYRFRNSIVHTGSINDYQVTLNADFLKYSVKVMLESAISDIEKGDIDEDIVSKISNSQINSHFNDWVNSFI